MKDWQTWAQEFVQTHAWDESKVNRDGDGQFARKPGVGGKPGAGGGKAAHIIDKASKREIETAIEKAGADSIRVDDLTRGRDSEDLWVEGKFENPEPAGGQYADDPYYDSPAFGEFVIKARKNEDGSASAMYQLYETDDSATESHMSQVLEKFLADNGFTDVRQVPTGDPDGIDDTPF